MPDTSAGWEFLSPLIGGAIGFGGEMYANAQALKRQREMQAWQEKMSGSAYQRSTADMRAAGLNPSMMFGSGSAASTPNVQPAPVRNPAGGLASAAADVVRLRNESLLARAEAVKKASEVEVNNKVLGLRGAETNESVKRLEEIAARVQELGTRSQLNVASAKGVLADVPRKEAMSEALKEVAAAIRGAVGEVKSAPSKGKAPYEDKIQPVLDKLLGDASKAYEGTAQNARERKEKADKAKQKASENSKGFTHIGYP